MPCSEEGNGAAEDPQIAQSEHQWRRHDGHADCLDRLAVIVIQGSSTRHGLKEEMYLHVEVRFDVYIYYSP